MRVSIARRVLAVAACLVCVFLLFGPIAGAVAPAPSSESVSHHWVDRAIGVMPYTESGPAETSAKKSAAKALTAAPLGIIRAADHGYADAQSSLALAKSLKNQNPVVVGHELIVFNDERAARVYVNADGATRLLDTGTVQEMLVRPTVAASDHGDLDAKEIALEGVALSAGLGRAVPGKLGVLVAGHVIGFAGDDGSHLVVRVGVDGKPSYQEW